MQVSIRYISAILSLSTAVACTADTPKVAKALLDVEGNTVSLWAPPDDPATTLNWLTHEPADGSNLAKSIRPGFIFTIVAPMALVTELDQNGNSLTQEDQGTLVAQLSVLTADGEAVFAGANISAVSFLAEGILKNPGPSNVDFQITANGLTDTFTIKAGDGLYIGSTAMVPTVAVKKGCLCDCKDSGGTLRVNLSISCPDASEQAAIDPQNPPCDCSEHHGLEYQYGTQGDNALFCSASNCRNGLVPVSN